MMNPKRHTRPGNGWHLIRDRVLPSLTVLTLSLAPWAGVHATDLLQAWQAAQVYDPELAAAHSDQAAGQARADQADSLWRPRVEVHAGVGKAGQDSQTRGAQFSAPGIGTVREAEFNTSLRQGTNSEYGIQVRQPLIDLERDANASRLRHSAAQSEAAWTAARQQAAIRVARRYFDVLLADHQLQVLQSQRQATARLLEQTRASYQAGDSSILDTHEAQARLGNIEASLRQASTQLAIARAAFSDLTGLANTTLAPLRSQTPLLSSPPKDPLEVWQARVDEASPDIRQSIEAAAMAAQQAEGLRGIAQVKLDLIGAAGRNHFSGSGAYGQAAQSSNQWSVGLELRIPLYTGGLRDASYREALAMRDSARFRTTATRQQISLLTQAAWLSLDSGAERIQALEQALKASAARRSATHLGVQVGDRTTLDMLDAELDYAQAQLALHQTLNELVLDRLQLQALAGRLDESSLEYINQSLDTQTQTLP